MPQQARTGCRRGAWRLPSGAIRLGGRLGLAMRRRGSRKPCRETRELRRVGSRPALPLRRFYGPRSDVVNLGDSSVLPSGATGVRERTGVRRNDRLRSAPEEAGGLPRTWRVSCTRYAAFPLRSRDSHASHSAMWPTRFSASTIVVRVVVPFAESSNQTRAIRSSTLHRTSATPGRVRRMRAM